MNKDEWFTQDEIRISVAMKIRRENFYHGGVMPRESALFWHGYLAGCGFGGGLSSADFWYLKGLLPDLEDNPIPNQTGERDDLPDDDAILALEPLTIPQASITEQIFPNGGTLTTAHPVPITKPKFINGKLEE